MSDIKYSIILGCIFGALITWLVNPQSAWGVLERMPFIAVELVYLGSFIGLSAAFSAVFIGVVYVAREYREWRK